MQHTITVIYCLCDDLLKDMGHHDDPQTRLSSAEVMTVPLVAGTFFGGNVELARRFLFEHRYIHTHLSKSRFNRRLHGLPSACWNLLFAHLGEVFKARNPTLDYVVDSVPLPVCDNIRISRCRLFPTAQYQSFRGYIASKRRYFYGLRLHLVITGQGHPVECVLADGGCADLAVFKLFDLDLPRGALIAADRAYNDYAEEDLLLDAGDITLQAQRRCNSKRPLAACLEFLSKPIRQRIETAFSQLTNFFPKHIHAVTPHGFVLKIMCFLLAYSIRCLTGLVAT